MVNDFLEGKQNSIPLKKVLFEIAGKHIKLNKDNVILINNDALQKDFQLFYKPVDDKITKVAKKVVDDYLRQADEYHKIFTSKELKKCLVLLAKPYINAFPAGNPHLKEVKGVLSEHAVHEDFENIYHCNKKFDGTFYPSAAELMKKRQYSAEEVINVIHNNGIFKCYEQKQHEDVKTYEEGLKKVHPLRKSFFNKEDLAKWEEIYGKDELLEPKLVREENVITPEDPKKKQSIHKDINTKKINIDKKVKRLTQGSNNQIKGTPHISLKFP